MRATKNRLKIDTLFVFGAGVSKSLTKRKNKSDRTTPLDSEFTTTIKEVKTSYNHKWVNGARERILNDWKYHIEFHEIGFEKAISQQISDLEFLKAIQPKKGNHNRTEIDYLEDISHITSFILSKAKLNETKTISKFIKKYFDDEIDNCKNRIITFNYDTLIDNLLIDKYKDYNKIYFDSIHASRRAKTKKTNFKKPLILKLHGSINWKCDKVNYEKVFLNKPIEKIGRTKTYNTDGCHFIDKIWIDKKVENPGNDIFPFIIPPIPDKPITNISIFRYLWTYAFEYLVECKELVISGYSLPETDNLAVSLFSKFENKNLRKITIIDPAPETVVKWNNLFNRKGIVNPKVEYYADFSSYVRSNC
jgi:hypothetical protein